MKTIYIMIVVLLISVSSFAEGKEVTFTYLKKNVFNICYFCHAGRFPYLERHSDVLKVVVPGKPDKSKLYQYVKSGRMPKGPARLSPENIESIRLWILSGAKNN